jgi:hypothetical protein
MLAKMEALETAVESEARQGGPERGGLERGKAECGSTEAKTSQCDTLKDVRMGTHSTLFSSFRQG